MVEVKRYDISLKLSDLTAPLAQSASNLPQAEAPAARVERLASTAPTEGAPAQEPPTELAQLLQTYAQLISQLHDVVSRIEQIDPTALTSQQATPPPSA
jgi:hypothetical protein